jgi:hypothetical protein
VNKVLIGLIKKYLQTSFFLSSLVVCAQFTLFLQQPVSKIRGRVFNFFGGRFEEIEESKQPAIQTKIVQHFIKYIKGCSYIAVLSTSER